MGMTETELYQAGKRYQNFEEDMQPEVKAMENAFIHEQKVRNNLQHMLWKLRLWPERIDAWSKFAESLMRGTWQAKYGFYREMRKKGFDRWGEPLDEES